MTEHNLRFDRSPVTVKHHSARGEVLRNTDNFTRGSQLISHQFTMFFAGIKIPLLMWFGIFVVIYWIMLSAVMGENEVQLCAMKLYSAVWGWLEFNPYKQMNVPMPGHLIRPTSIGYIGYLPEVQTAWAKATHALAGSIAASLLIAMPLVWWFINLSNSRGSSILQERHERGAMLVSRVVLMEDILAHNKRMFISEAARVLPDLKPEEVLELPFVERKAAGIHHPYSIAGVPYPHGLEQSHTIIIGTTGSGKTTQLRDLTSQIRARQDSAVIFDLTGAYVEAFYNPATDVILNPLDTRCPSWSIFNDCSTQAEFTACAPALIPSDGNSGDPFWALAARTLFVEMCMKLQAAGLGTNKELARNLMTADLKHVHKILQNTVADPITAPEAARMGESIRATFNTNAQALRFLPEDGPRFSIREWIARKDKPGSILFVTSTYNDLIMNKALLTLWMDLALNTLMTLPRTRQLRTWFMFDELGALHRLPAIESGLQTARGFGGAMILGMHSFARLKAIYGDEGAENLTSLARTKLILATADLDTAEHCARFIGNREVRQMDEAYSYGKNSLRDANTLTPRKQVEPLVIADDITNLPALHGFLKFPDGFPAARIQLKWKDYPTVAEGFILRDVPRPPTQPIEPEGEPDDDGPNDRDGGAEIVAEIEDPSIARATIAAEQAATLMNPPESPESKLIVETFRSRMSINVPAAKTANDAPDQDKHQKAASGLAQIKPGDNSHDQSIRDMSVNFSLEKSTDKSPDIADDADYGMEM